MPGNRKEDAAAAITNGQGEGPLCFPRVSGLAKKFRLPVYITGATLDNGRIPLDPELVRPFRHREKIAVGALQITPFRKSHDAADPHSFMVSAESVNIGIITDIGYACKQVIRYYSQCHAVFLESNYCEKMLEKGSYPWHLKQRIRGDEGHLSNDQALELFRHYSSPSLQLLVLSHLSKNNNSVETVQQLFEPHAGNVRVVVASRYEASELFEISNKDAVVQTARRARLLKKVVADERQLKLF